MNYLQVVQEIVRIPPGSVRCEPQHDELLEVGIVDNQGRVLFESLVRPLRRTEWPDAQQIHGITPAAVATAPTISELLPLLAEILGQADLVMAYKGVGRDSCEFTPKVA